MANIELVIKLPEKYYKAIMKIPVTQSTADMLIIKNGTILPKGHGDLIDKSQIETSPVVGRIIWKMLFNGVGIIDGIRKILNSVSTIIEADKDGE